MHLSKFQLFISAVLFSLVAAPMVRGGERDSNDSLGRASRAMLDPTVPYQYALPGQWSGASPAASDLPPVDRWWERFDDPLLDSLIAMANDANYDVASAVARMQAARAQLDASSGAYYPTIGVQTAYTHARTQGAATVNSWSTGANASWEIDLFGRVAAQTRSARAAWRASAADVYAARLSMAAQIASSYIDLRMAQAQLEVANEHILRQDTIAGIARTRFECGLAAKIDVDQALITLYSTRAAVPGLKTQIRRDINALALLTARAPQELEGLLAQPRPMPDYRTVVATGVPSDLLRRRPDILSAEAAVNQAAAQLGIARKDYLPSLSLQGSIGWANTGRKPEFGSNSFVYSIAPTLSWTVFDGFARKSATSAAKAQLQAAVAQYNLAVGSAYSDADNALAAYTNSLTTVTDFQAAQATSAEFLDLALDLYTQGLSNFTNVANAQQSYLQNANSAITAHAQALQNLVKLYRSLGGSVNP